MYLAYFDESGDSGVTNSPTRFFVLSCILVHRTKWLESLNGLIAMRRLMRDSTGISTRAETKAIEIRKGRGPLLPLRWSIERRMTFYRNVMSYVATNFAHLTIFSVAIDKKPCADRGHDPRQRAWQFALQRVNRFCDDGNHGAMIFPDEGHGILIKRMIRKMRRYEKVPKKFGGGSFTVPIERIVEDPNDRKSHDSYFIQLADWCAFAAHRSQHIDPHAPVHDGLWDLLGDRLLLKVNLLAGGPPGIKVYPDEPAAHF
jgi:Protein of unknown function (DUF3800)